MEKIAIKGFNSDMTCRGFQYEVGKTYEIDDKPKLCRSGFHFCYDFKDVQRYYQQGVYCKVEILGDIDKGTDKACTNKIKILEVIDDVPNDGFFNYKKLEYICNIGFVIAGSMALKLHGYSLPRTINEVDFAIEKYSQDVLDKVRDNFSACKEHKRFSGMDSLICYSGIYGEKYDFLTSNNIEYEEIEIYGAKLRVQKVNQIFKHKLRYALNGVTKHMNDLLHLEVKFEPVLEETENLNIEMPF